MSKLVAYITISIIAGASGQLMMKLGIQQLSFLSNLVALVWLALGVACYLLAMLLWLKVLRLLPLSVAYPLLSLGYIVVYLGAYFLPDLAETFSYQKSVGIGLIILGVILIASKPKELISER